METIEKGLYLGSIISPGIDGDLVLLGFPYEIGTKRAGIPCSGLENGPDCLRRFLPKLGPLINPEQNLSIQSLRLKDYGNLIIKEKDPSLEDLLLKLETKCLSIMKRKGIPLVLGGGHEVALGGVRALCGVSEGKNGVLHVNIRAGLDCEIFYDGNKVTSRNVLRKLITEAQEEKKEYKAFCFSVEEALLTKHEIDFLKENTDRIEVYSMKKIRKVKVQSDISDNVFEPITQAGQGLVNFLKGVKENIYVSFSLEAINAAFCPGVTNPCVIGGLNSEEVMEIMQILGRERLVKGIDLTDYNPKYEDYRTGLLLGYMIYYFNLGVASRPKSQLI